MSIPITDPDALLDALDPEQREVAAAGDGPICVLAGAGTGKTRAITHRIAYAVRSGRHVPHQVLAVTFTARAAGELRTRLRELGVDGVQARTFHAAALRQLSFFWPRAVGGGPPSVLEHKAALVADAASRLGHRLDRPAVRDLSAEVEWAKVSLLTPATYPAGAARAGRGFPGGLDLATTGRLLEVYEQLKTDRGVIDFEDVLLLTTGILEQHPDIAAAVRAQYRHFLVDEYQDVNALQQRLLDAWLGDRDDLCVVGDPNQTIYSFTGATPQYLLGFRTRYPGATQVQLVRDYRSTPQVVALANALAEQPRGRQPMRLWAQRPDGPRPVVRAYDDDEAEARAVAAQAAELVGTGVPPSEIAVLYRTNAQSEALEHALTEVGLPYLLRGGERFFARKEVRDAILLLRGAARAASLASGGSGDDVRAGAGAGEERASLGRQARDVLVSAGWSPQPPAAGGSVRERWEALQALAALADSLALTRPGATLAELVADLEQRAQAQHAPTVQGITLASLHAAKGLEWDAVFLVGLSDGLMPISLAEGWDAIAEERRLLYVGVTRARERLVLSWARSRTPGGRAVRARSPFLDPPAVTAVLVDPLGGTDSGASGGTGGGTGTSGSAGVRGPRRRNQDGGTRVSARSRPASCRTCGTVLDTAAERKIGRCADCPPSYDEQTLATLQQWRRQTAADAKVPAYVVFTDATLIAIAESRPADLGALSRLPGVGRVKLERYGPAVLAAISPPP